MLCIRRRHKDRHFGGELVQHDRKRGKKDLGRGKQEGRQRTKFSCEQNKKDGPGVTALLVSAYGVAFARCVVGGVCVCEGSEGFSYTSIPHCLIACFWFILEHPSVKTLESRVLMMYVNSVRILFRQFLRAVVAMLVTNRPGN